MKPKEEKISKISEKETKKELQPNLIRYFRKGRRINESGLESQTDFVLTGIISDEIKDNTPTGFKTLRIGVSFCKGNADEVKVTEGDQDKIITLGPDSFNRKEGRRRSTYRAYYDPIAIFTLSRTRSNTKFQSEAFFASQAFFISQMPKVFYGSVKPIDEQKFYELFGRYTIDEQKSLNKKKALEKRAELKK